MNVKRIFGLLIATALFFPSCDNTIKILAPYKDVTVVYGLVDQNDPVHYFRINKAFEGPGNAYTMAQVYDSIYYPVSEITAVLQDSSLITNSVINTYVLDTTTTVPLGPGTFSYPKQLLYYTKATLNPADDYNIVITNNRTGKKTTGSTGLLSDIAFTSPDNFGSPGVLTMSNNAMYPTNITWTSTPNGRIYQMTIRFYYDEQVGSGPRALQSLDWIQAPITSPTLAGNATLQYSITAQGLYSLILSSVHYQQGVSYYPDSLAVLFTTGSDDLNTYVELSQPSLGINQDVPSFTDVKNGIGLFTSRHIQAINKQIDGQTLDSLTTEQRFVSIGFAP